MVRPKQMSQDKSNKYKSSNAWNAQARHLCTVFEWIVRRFVRTWMNWTLNCCSFASFNRSINLLRANELHATVALSELNCDFGQSTVSNVYRIASSILCHSVEVLARDNSFEFLDIDWMSIQYLIRFSIFFSLSLRFQHFFDKFVSFREDANGHQFYPDHNQITKILEFGLKLFQFTLTMLHCYMFNVQYSWFMGSWGMFAIAFRLGKKKGLSEKTKLANSKWYQNYKGTI